MNDSLKVMEKRIEELERKYKKIINPVRSEHKVYALTCSSCKRVIYERYDESNIYDNNYCETKECMNIVCEFCGYCKICKELKELKEVKCKYCGCKYCSVENNNK